MSIAIPKNKDLVKPSSSDGGNVHFEFLEFALPERKTVGLGQPVRLGGMSRWAVDNVSIFDVKQGKQFAATPRREPSIFEIKRAAAIERAANETPLIGKYRLYPTLSPGKALFWGTMVAITGTMIGTKLACIVLDIRSVRIILTDGFEKGRLGRSSIGKDESCIGSI